MSLLAESMVCDGAMNVYHCRNLYICCTQVVRARLQQRQAQNRAVQYRDGLATFRLILQREGAGGLYKGLGPTVLGVMPQSAISFLVYEMVMQLLETEVFRNLEQSWGH